MKVESMLVIVLSALSILVYLLSILISLSSKVFCCGTVVFEETEGTGESSDIVLCGVVMREISIGIVAGEVIGVDSRFDKCCSIAVKRVS